MSAGTDPKLYTRESSTIVLLRRGVIAAGGQFGNAASGAGEECIIVKRHPTLVPLMQEASLSRKIPRRSFFVVVPVLNEAPNLDRLLSAFRELVAEFGADHTMIFLLIDDGSTDHTADLARKLAGGLDLRVLRHEINMGPGRAFATAFEYLGTRISAGDWVATMEGDNTSRHQLIGQMLVRSREGYDVMLASPYQYGGGIENTSGLRVLLSHVANGFLKSAIGLHGFLTMSSFFRLHSATTILRLQACYGPAIIERAGFEGVVEMLIKMVLLKTRVTELPMVLDTSRRVGKSKMKVLRTIRGYLTLAFTRPRWIAQTGKFLAREAQNSAEVKVAQLNG